MQVLNRGVLIIIFFILSMPYLPVYANAKKELIGLWKTYDLHHKARSIIEFYPINGEYHAAIVQVISDPTSSTYCVNCKGTNKNKPLVGMTIIQGLKFKEDKWVEGEVINTDTGKTYRCLITLKNHGETMLFHAYIKHPLIGRTVKWQRV